MFRQGDLYFSKTGTIPKTAKVDTTGILLLGESTGHAHRVTGGDLLRKNGLMFLKVAKKAVISHEEHKPITLGKGMWAVTRQREYAGKDMVKVVVD